MFERILVAVDGSDHSQKSMGIACDIAQKYDAELYMVHTPQLETTAVAVGAGVVAINSDPASIVESGRLIMEEAATQATKMGATVKDTLIGDGDPADDILQYADLMDIDLIVMGRRGLGGIASLLLGSVSQKVSHGAKCTCMTVHH